MYTCTNVKMYLLYIHLECMHEKCVYIDGHILRTSIFPKFQNLYLEHILTLYLEHTYVY